VLLAKLLVPSDPHWRSGSLQVERQEPKLQPEKLRCDVSIVRFTFLAALALLLAPMSSSAQFQPCSACSLGCPSMCPRNYPHPGGSNSQTEDPRIAEASSWNAQSTQEGYLGRDAFRAGRYEEAKEHALQALTDEQNAVRIYPWNDGTLRAYARDLSTTYYNLGLVEVELGEFNAAINQYKLAINSSDKHNPDLWSYFDGAGAALYREGDFNDALQWLAAAKKYGGRKHRDHVEEQIAKVQRRRDEHSQPQSEVTQTAPGGAVGDQGTADGQAPQQQTPASDTGATAHTPDTGGALGQLKSVNATSVAAANTGPLEKASNDAQQGVDTPGAAGQASSMPAPASATNSAAARAQLVLQTLQNQENAAKARQQNLEQQLEEVRREEQAPGANKGELQVKEAELKQAALQAGYDAKVAHKQIELTNFAISIGKSSSGTTNGNGEPSPQP
jgi:tetratricopeptide (TPR) repeat protein